MLRASYTQRGPSIFFYRISMCLSLMNVVALVKTAAIAILSSFFCSGSSSSHVQFSFQRSFIRSLARNVAGAVHPKASKFVATWLNVSLVVQTDSECCLIGSSDNWSSLVVHCSPRTCISRFPAIGCCSTRFNMLGWFEVYSRMFIDACWKIFLVISK